MSHTTTRARVRTGRFLARALFAVVFFAAPSRAAITQSVDYEGFLKDTGTGLPTNKTKDMEFHLYSQASGGSSLWNEQRCGVNGVPVLNGRYEVEIGSKTAGGVPSARFLERSALWLEVRVDANDDCSGFAALSPRVRLLTAPFVFNALSVSTAASVGNAADAVLVADSDANGSGALVVKAGGVERMRVLNAGNVGVGVSAPAAKLHVSSASAAAGDAILLVSSGTGQGQQLLTVMGDGKVGISTGAPAALLAVAGKAQVNSTMTVYGNLVATTMGAAKSAFIHIRLNQCGGGCGGSHTVDTWTDVAAQGYAWTQAINTSPETFVHNGTGRITVNKAGLYRIRLYAFFMPSVAGSWICYVCPSVNGSAGSCTPNSAANGLKHGYNEAAYWARMGGPYEFIRALSAGNTVGWSYYPSSSWPLTYWAYDNYTSMSVEKVN
ncbi:MAG: hypothetical protein WC969_14385 [Elusimicrobiota bacterium]